MEKNTLMRILRISGYLTLLFISTWATVESGERLLPGWPVLFLWILSAIFFSIASWGAKLIIASFDQSERRNGRIYILLGGIALMVSFWIIVILPTNTHTFFYKSIIVQTAKEELKQTETELSNFAIDGQNQIFAEKSELEEKVLREISNYQHEILNIGNPGSGVRAEEILLRIENYLGSDIKINRLTLPSKRQADLKRYAEQMELAIKEQLKSVLKNKYDARMEILQSSLDKQEINKLITAIKVEVKYVDQNQRVRKETRNLLIDCFSMIARYSDRLRTNTSTSKSIITASSSPRIIELENVYQVWKNFFAGKYINMGFGYWIIISVLIDLAGFIMFFWIVKKEY